MSRYQDFVIKDGQLVGDFEGLYQRFDDPWHQSGSEHLNDTRRTIAVQSCSRLRATHGEDQVNRVIEYGCGFGYLTDELRNQNFSSVGIDVSQEAIRKARVQNPKSVFLKGKFEDPKLLIELDPDIIVMAEITWYVLDHLEEFKNRFLAYSRSRARPTYLIHLLTTYPPGVQQYGVEKFTEINGILDYFDLDYLESGTISATRSDEPMSLGTYFIGRAST